MQDRVPMREVPSNSNISREVEEKQAPDVEEARSSNVASGKVREESFGDIAMKSIFASTIGGTASYLLGAIIFPSIKNLLHDLVTVAADHVFFGDSVSRPRRGRGPSRTDYSSISREPGRERSYYSRPSSRGRISDVIFESQAEARAVLEELQRTMNRYSSVTLKDFYDACGLSSQWTDLQYGWTNPRVFDTSSVTIGVTRGGYYLKNIPEPVEL